MQGYLHTFLPELEFLSEPLVQSSVDIYLRIQKELLPTPLRSEIIYIPLSSCITSYFIFLLSCFALHSFFTSFSFSFFIFLFHPLEISLSVHCNLQFSTPSFSSALLLLLIFSPFPSYFYSILLLFSYLFSSFILSTRLYSTLLYVSQV